MPNFEPSSPAKSSSAASNSLSLPAFRHPNPATLSQDLTNTLEEIQGWLSTTNAYDPHAVKQPPWKQRVYQPLAFQLPIYQPTDVWPEGSNRGRRPAKEDDFSDLAGTVIATAKTAKKVKATLAPQ